MTPSSDIPLGPVMLDVSGTELTPEDRERLRHPATGGVILFTRNADTLEQVRALTDAIRAERPRILIAVDQEGGRVQRLSGQGFTRIPPMRELGRINDADPSRADVLACTLGELLALELQTAGIDFSFAPVLDRDVGVSEVIGDRALHSDPDVIARLAGGLVRGLAAGGIASVGKHFPGHGAVIADSHLELPIDDRPLNRIESEDIAAFQPVLADLAAVMPAHVVYSQVDDRPAGFSHIWLQNILRRELRFRGAILSDDLAMAGAVSMGDVTERAQAAREAGCDMVLICNQPEQADRLLEALAGQPPLSEKVLQRLEALRARPIEVESRHLEDLRSQVRQGFAARAATSV